MVSGVDLSHLRAAQAASGALALLSVRERSASRLLLFDNQNRLCGWENPATGVRQWAAGPVSTVTRLGFDGIQVLSAEILGAFVETGAFSLTQAYLRLAGQGKRILAWRADAYYWADIGSMEKLAAVERHVAAHGLPA